MATAGIYENHEEEKLKNRLMEELHFSEEMTALYDAATAYVRKEIFTKREIADIFPMADFLEKEFRSIFELGYFHLTLPEKFSGLGYGMKELNAVLLAMAPLCASTCALLLTQTMSMHTLATYADEQHEILQSNSFIAYPIYHDAREVWQDLTVENGLLSGQIRTLSLAPIADSFIIPVSEQGETSLYLISKTAKGVEVADALFMHGLRQCPVGDVFFKAVDLSQAIRIGKEREGQEILISQRNRFASAFLTVCGGNALGAFIEANNYMCQRYQTGTLLIEKSPLKVLLAKLKILAFEALFSANRLADFIDADSDSSKLNSDDIYLSPFIHFRDAISEALPDAIQLMGGYGYMRDYNQEKRYRDGAQLQLIFGRTEFLQSDIIESERVV